MDQAESLAFFQLLHKVSVLFVHVEKGVQIPCIGVLVLAADVAGALFFVCPCRHGIVDFPGAFQPVHKGELCRFEFLDFTGKFAVYLLKMGFQDPGISERVSILEHL